MHVLVPCALPLPFAWKSIFKIIIIRSVITKVKLHPPIPHRQHAPPLVLTQSKSSSRLRCPLPHPPPNLFSPSPNPSFPPSPTPQSKNQFSIFTFPQPNSEDHPLLELYNKCANIHGEAHQEQVGRWSLDENKRKTVDLWWSIIAWRTPFCADKISSEMGSTGLCHNSYLIWQFCKIMKIFHLIGDKDKL